MTRPGEHQLSFEQINKIKQMLGIKRLLYLLRFFMKLAGKRKDENPQKNKTIKRKIFEDFEEASKQDNHIMVCKKILEVIFKLDPIDDYLQYSTASEEDSSYSDCERQELESSGSSSSPSGKTSGSKSSPVNLDPNPATVEEEEFVDNGMPLRVNQEQFELCQQYLAFLLERCQTIGI